MRRKKVELNTLEGASISINNILVDSTHYQLKLRKHRFKDITTQIRKKGYKTKRAILYANKVHPILFFPPAVLLEFGGGYYKNYEKEWNFELTKFPEIADTANQVSIDRIQIDSNIESSTYRFKNIKNWKKGKALDNQYDFDFNSSLGEEVEEKHNESVSHRLLNNFLENIKLQDESSFSMINYKDYSIKIKVLKLDQYVVGLYKNTDMKYFEMDVEYIIKDKYGKELIREVVSSTSDQFLYTKRIETVFYDALYYNIIKLHENDKVLSLFNANKDILNDMSLKVFVESESNFKVNFDSITSTALYLKMNTKNIVGLPISKDGLVAFSKSAIIYSDSLMIFNAKGDSSFATEYFEIAPKEISIVKTDFTFDNYYQLDTTSMNIGDESILTGFDRTFNTLLLSKGIISGKRKEDNEIVYQIDAEANYMIYPIVLSKQGKIKGFVSRKLDSYDVNSIAFFPSLKEN